MFEIKKDENQIVSFIFNRKDKSTNLIDIKFLKELTEQIDQIIKDDTVRGVIFTSSLSDFVAGADLNMLKNLNTKQEFKKLVSDFHILLRKMETSLVPYVAAINGPCLGGGYELVLACNYRIAMANPKTKVGLPEVQLGLLPGGGGTQRLPRMIGIKNALPILLEGRTLKVEKALEVGLIDDIADSFEDMIQIARQWIQDNPQVNQPWDRENFKIPGGGVQSPMGYQIFPAATAMLKSKTFGNYPAPLNILSCVYEGLQLPFDQGCEVEINYFADLAERKETKKMINTLFFSYNECKKAIDRSKEIEPSRFSKVAILGAGMMGHGIAYVTLKAGIPVVLKDIKQEYADRGYDAIVALFTKDVELGKMSEARKNECLSLLVATDNPNTIEGSDLVIEAVIEDREVKEKVTADSEEVISDSAIIASNTSMLPITGLAARSKRPENFIGLHFFSPVDKMPLVEIIRGEKTSNFTIAKSLDFVRAIKKIPIVVNDGRGFFTSRVFTSYIEEGVLCMVDGAPPALVENAAKMAGMPVGPLAVADEVSLELIYQVLWQTKNDLGDDAVNDKFEKIITKFVNEFGRKGRKVRKGFYDYPDQGQKHLWPGFEIHFNFAENKLSVGEIKDRLLFRQVIETFLCFSENVLTTSRDADVGSVFGLGFPSFTGGAFSYVDFYGKEKFIARAKDLQEKYGSQFMLPDDFLQIFEKFNL